MRINTQYNVYESALWRIENLYNEFDEVAIAFSGGKDSTVVLNLALEVAEKLNKLPVPVIFIDQEGEWKMTEDYMRIVMYDKRVNPMWFQIPFDLSNETSQEDSWLQCWDPDEKENWIREQDPISIKENVYGTRAFYNLFTKITDHHFKGSLAMLGGLRTEESPMRQVACTQQATYKWITYGKKLNEKMNHYTFYPIYDWSYIDVWKYIHDKDLEYNKLYDYQYQHGWPIRNMRVSSLTHGSALVNLQKVQEIEPETWVRFTKRMKGINTLKHLKDDFMKPPKDLPYMFATWREYRDYLLENLIVHDEHRSKFAHYFERHDRLCEKMVNKDIMYKQQVKALIRNDYHSTILDEFERTPDYTAFRKWVRTGERPKIGKNKYIPND